MDTIQTSDLKREFIIRLIQQDLKVHQLRRGLQELGFYSDVFYTDIPQMVLELMGFGPEDLDIPLELYLDYLEGLGITKLVDVDQVKSVATNIFNILRLERISNIGIAI